MSTVTKIFNNAELSSASYANLVTTLGTGQQLGLLIAAGMSQKQAEEFAARYSEVIAISNDPLNTGFSATVFKSSEGQLTLAIRGTDGFIGTDGDDDLDILFNGVAKEQILEMVNWWARITAQAGSSVTQLAITPYLNGSSSVTGAKFLYSIPNGNSTTLNYYLEPVSNAVATGELYGRGDQQLSITGHSLGGHLAMAFGTLFPAVTESVTVFNAPGFDTNTISQSFFQALGGSVPTGQSTTNVIANQASGDDVTWSGIAGWHSRPGTAIDIAIEDQFGLDSDEPFLTRANSRNHSQMILTDSLAVYNMLDELVPALTTSEYHSILSNVTNTTSGSYERIVDTLEALFGLNDTPLPTGNNQRNELYKAIYSVRTAASSYRGLLTIQSVESLAGDVDKDSAQGQAYRYALINLNPFAITGPASLYTARADALTADNFTEQYLRDRAYLLTNLLVVNQADSNYVNRDSREYFRDVAQDKEFITATTPPIFTTPAADMERYYFDNDLSHGIEGGDQNDHLYGGGGDLLFGGAGNNCQLGQLGGIKPPTQPIRQISL